MKTRTIIFILAVLFAGIGIVQIALAHKLSTAGVALTKIEQDIQNLGRENEDMRHKIASNSSLLSLSKRAETMGFLTARYYYIDYPVVAFKK